MPNSLEKLRREMGFAALEREAIFHPEFRQDWVETDRPVAVRAVELIASVLRDPFVGLG